MRKPFMFLLCLGCVAAQWHQSNNFNPQQLANSQINPGWPASWTENAISNGKIYDCLL